MQAASSELQGLRVFATFVRRHLARFLLVVHSLTQCDSQEGTAFAYANDTPLAGADPWQRG